MNYIRHGKMPRLALLSALLLATAACGSRTGSEQGATGGSVHAAQIVVGGDTIRSGVDAVANRNGSVWLPLDEVSASLGFRTLQQDGQILIGGTDAAYAVRLNDKRAYAGETAVDLPDAPTTVKGRTYLSAASFPALMGMPMNWVPDRSQFVITPSLTNASDGTGGTAAGIADGSGTFRSLAAGGGGSQEAISYAKRFLGTPYQFNAGPYAQTGRFDCSSFMRHVFQHVGVDLPRTARQQANVGRVVQDSQMQPGDLMFFYTPGRYSSNRVVGHVGMYIGDNRFIQTWGSPGVVISDLNAYWKGRFLFAKRVL